MLANYFWLIFIKIVRIWCRTLYKKRKGNQCKNILSKKHFVYFTPHQNYNIRVIIRRLLGYKFNDNVAEDNSKYMKRLSGLMRLYAAVIISKSRRGVNKPHPFGIENAWIWLTNILNYGMLNTFLFSIILNFDLLFFNSQILC